MPPRDPACRSSHPPSRAEAYAVSLVVRMIERELVDVPADVTDPADRRGQEYDQAERDEVPGQRDRDDRERERGRVDQRQRARRRHVHLFADRRDVPVVDGLAHWTYSSAATKVSANMSRPITAVIRPVRTLRRARRRSMARSLIPNPAR